MNITAQLQRLIHAMHRELSVYYVARSFDIFEQLRPQASERILDLGCSWGLWTAALASKAGMVVGVDLQRASVRKANKQMQKLAYSNVALVVASATDLPFTEAAFDKVLCVDVIDNIPDDHRAAVEIERVLQAAGQAVITALLKERKHYLRTITFPEHLRNYTPASFEQLLTDGGLQVCSDFSFYHPISTVAWEIASAFHTYRLSRLPGLGFALGIVLSTIVRFDRRSKSAGAGVGLLLKKPVM